MRKFLITIVTVFLSIFSVSASIQITSPNGGENWNSCSINNITWNASNTSGYYDIDYSLDNGFSWTSVATSYNTTMNSFPWNIPNVSSVQCIVRVTDAQNTADFDVSNNLFVLNGALIGQYPHGGESFVAGDTVNMVYSYQQGVVNNIRVEFSSNGGDNWQILESSLSANGTYDFIIPNVPSSQCQLRLTDLIDSGCKTDTLDGRFTIVSSVQVSSPNGGKLGKQMLVIKAYLL